MNFKSLKTKELLLFMPFHLQSKAKIAIIKFWDLTALTKVICLKLYVCDILCINVNAFGIVKHAELLSFTNLFNSSFKWNGRPLTI